MFPTGVFYNLNYDAAPQELLTMHKHFLKNTARLSNFNNIAKHWTSNLMLLLTAPDKLEIQQSILSWSLSDVTNIEAFRNYLNRIHHRGDNSDASIRLYTLTKNVRKGFKELDAAMPPETHLKGVELILQENRDYAVKCYKENNNLIIYSAGNITWGMYQKILALYPKLFKKDYAADKLELFKWFGKQDYETWLQKYIEYVENNNLNEVIKKSEFMEFFEILQQSELEKIELEIKALKRNIENKQTELRDHYARLNDRNIIRAGLEHTKKDAHTDFLEFLETNKMVKHISTTPDKRLELHITAPLNFFENDMLVAVLQNKNHPINLDEPDRKYVKELFKAMSENKCKIYCDSAFYLDPVRKTLEPITYDATANFPHPHLNRYRCLGSNQTYILEAMHNEDYLQAGFQIIAACQNLNIADSVVFRNFIETLERHLDKKAIFDLEENKFYTIKEAVEKYEDDTTTPESTNDASTTDSNTVNATEDDGLPFEI